MQQFKILFLRLNEETIDKNGIISKKREKTIKPQ